MRLVSAGVLHIAPGNLLRQINSLELHMLTDKQMLLLGFKALFRSSSLSISNHYFNCTQTVIVSNHVTDTNLLMTTGILVERHTGILVERHQENVAK